MQTGPTEPFKKALFDRAASVVLVLSAQLWHLGFDTNFRSFAFGISLSGRLGQRLTSRGSAGCRTPGNSEVFGGCVFSGLPSSGSQTRVLNGRGSCKAHSRVKREPCQAKAAITMEFVIMTVVPPFRVAPLKLWCPQNVALSVGPLVVATSAATASEHTSPEPIILGLSYSRSRFGLSEISCFFTRRWIK